MPSSCDPQCYFISLVYFYSREGDRAEAAAHSRRTGGAIGDSRRSECVDARARASERESRERQEARAREREERDTVLGKCTVIASPRARNTVAALGGASASGGEVRRPVRPVAPVGTRSVRALVVVGALAVGVFRRRVVALEQTLQWLPWTSAVVFQRMAQSRATGGALAMVWRNAIVSRRWVWRRARRRHEAPATWVEEPMALKARHASCSAAAATAHGMQRERTHE